MKKQSFEPLAELLKALANPVRLELLFALKDGHLNATNLCEQTGLSKANLSQHINRLKNDGLVICVKEGTYCYYNLSAPELLEKLVWIQNHLHKGSKL